MTGFFRRAMSVGSVACVVAAAGFGASSVMAGDSSAEARIDWAKRHVELVCRPLEANKLSARAAKCYEEVSLFIADPKREIPSEVEAIPLRRTASESPAKPKAAMSQAAPARTVPTKAVAAAKPAVKQAVAAVKQPEPKAVAAASVQNTPGPGKIAEAKAGEVKRPVRRVVRVASVRHPKRRVADVRPVVVASNDRLPVALAAAQDNVNARRCGLPCTRFTTILGVGY